jgi:multiple RNA-binding domain-containing protein 1
VRNSNTFFMLKFIFKFSAGKRISVLKYSAKNETESLEINDDSRKSKWVSQEEALKNEEDIAESGKIFIRNLSYTTTEDDIETLFKNFGKYINEVICIYNILK